MDPVTGLVLLAVVLAAKSGEAFAQELGRDAYAAAERVVGRFRTHLADDDDARRELDAGVPGAAAESAAARFLAVDENAHDDLRAVTDAPEYQAFVRQRIADSTRVWGFRGSGGAAHGNIRVEQEISNSSGIVGAEVTDT